MRLDLSDRALAKCGAKEIEKPARLLGRRLGIILRLALADILIGHIFEAIGGRERARSLGVVTTLNRIPAAHVHLRQG